MTSELEYQFIWFGSAMTIAMSFAIKDVGSIN